MPSGAQPQPSSFLLPASLGRVSEMRTLKLQRPDQSSKGGPGACRSPSFLCDNFLVKRGAAREDSGGRGTRMQIAVTDQKSCCCCGALSCLRSPSSIAEPRICPGFPLSPPQCPWQILLSVLCDCFGRAACGCSSVVQQATCLSPTMALLPLQLISS